MSVEQGSRRRSAVNAGIVAATTCCLSLAFISPSNATPTPHPRTTHAFSAPADDETGNYQEIQDAFSAIQSIPDDILERGNVEEISRLLQATLPSADMPGRADVAGCATAILVFAVANLPPLKLLKLKKALNAAGGATRAARTLYDSYKYATRRGYSRSTAIRFAIDRASSGGGAELRELLLEMFSVGTVAGQCF